MAIPGLPYSDEQLFQLLHGVLPAWALLLLWPRLGIPAATIAAALYAVLYAATLAGSILESGEDNAMAEMFTFEGVAKLLCTRSAVLPAWVHYVVFDLWVGRWEMVDALSRGVPRLLMALPLLLTMMFGPVGLLLYLAAIRPWFRERSAVALASGAARKED